MRDVHRIDKLCDKIKDLWYKFPDMRYIQFLEYILSFLPEEKKNIDLFYLEDNDLMEAVLQLQKSIYQDK